MILLTIALLCFALSPVTPGASFAPGCMQYLCMTYVTSYKAENKLCVIRMNSDVELILAYKFDDSFSK